MPPAVHWPQGDSIHAPGRTSTLENQATYGYGATDGRLATVADASHTFTYGYLANSALVETVTATAGAVHTVTNTWEPDRDVLASKQNKVGSTVVSQYDYTVNAIGQRTSAHQAFVAAARRHW